MKLSMTRQTPEGPRETFLLGLSNRNVELLRQKRPIVVALDESLGGPPVDIIIQWGETEGAIVTDLRAAGVILPPPEVE